ncbi:MAG: hypothetical protein ACKPKO_34645 [Candidatus Fonsibacter sp.]
MNFPSTFLFVVSSISGLTDSDKSKCSLLYLIPSYISSCLIF